MNDCNSLPITEPCPIGWIKTRIMNVDGTMTDHWIAPRTIMEGKPYSTLTPEQIERVTKCQWTLRNVDPRPLDKWLYNFSCDTNPEPEIRIHEAIARAYRRITRNVHHAKQQKQQLWHFLNIATLQPNYNSVISGYPQYKSRYYEEAYVVLCDAARTNPVTPEERAECDRRNRERMAEIRKGGGS